MPRDGSKLGSVKPVAPTAVVISLIGSADLALGYAVTRTDGLVQIVLLVYVILLTTAVTHKFFHLLSTRPWSFHTPDQYPPTMSPISYAEANDPKRKDEGLIPFNEERKILGDITKSEHVEVLNSNHTHDYTRSIQPWELEAEFLVTILTCISEHLHRRSVERDNGQGLAQAIKHLFSGDDVLSSGMVELLLRKGFLVSPTPDRFMLSEEAYRVIRRVR